MTKIIKFLSAISVLPSKTDCRTRSGFATQLLQSNNARSVRFAEHNVVNYQIYHAMKKEDRNNPWRTKKTFDYVEDKTKHKEKKHTTA